ncbi:D-alanyl-D-alanine carboxypeptidase / D-alanyl-D-alanine-endopeptidase (penicillin-binding protein 4) [Jiangella sp. DSM 45060]|nr:D-alanyl-D-alanine carboxypeptidase / D-alanyl-D-alanine-endopeptidase (penicillin-binding protein 4) [Jiangella sp. DSM 45060]
MMTTALVAPVVARPAAAASTASGGDEFAAAVRDIVGRPEFAGARWGAVIARPGTDPVYTLRPDELFAAGSSSKIFIAATAYSTLGPDHRFRTPVYRTGPVEDGVLHGDLVLVAGGDLVLGGRIQPDGSVFAPEPDHTYPGRPPAPGDPLAVLRRLAAEVAAAGVTRVGGHVVVDASLYAETPESAGGVAMTVSPLTLNDNVIDVTVTPGAAPGAPARLTISPDVGYVTIVNEVATVSPGGPPGRPLRYTGDVANADGTRTVTLIGDLPAGAPDVHWNYPVPGPARFGELAFAQALREAGVEAQAGPSSGASAPEHYTRPNRLAEHVSPPLSEVVKVMLKPSSNVHATGWQYVIGAIAGHDRDDPLAGYARLRQRLFRRAGLDTDPPGSADNDYTPAFFVDFLAYLSRQRWLPEFRPSLAILGRDGTLTDVSTDSPAAGHVFAKTGTSHRGGGPDTDQDLAKALAGFIERPGGDSLLFGVFMEHTVPAADATKVQQLAGQAIGDIVTAAYLLLGEER